MNGAKNAGKLSLVRKRGWEYFLHFLLFQNAVKSESSPPA
jgi:hypothetical protein